MSCLQCASNFQGEFAAEMIIHFSGLKNLNKPGIWAFPKLLVCLDCGFSWFTVEKTELTLLANRPSEAEALALESGLERFDCGHSRAVRSGP